MDHSLDPALTNSVQEKFLSQPMVLTQMYDLHTAVDIAPECAQTCTKCHNELMELMACSMTTGHIVISLWADVL